MYSIKDEDKKQLRAEITHFFGEEYELELGIIGFDKILDFFLEVLGDKIYNKGLDDAKAFYKKYAENMDTDFYSLYREK